MIRMSVLCPGGAGKKFDLDFTDITPQVQISELVG